MFVYRVSVATPEPAYLDRDASGAISTNEKAKGATVNVSDKPTNNMDPVPIEVFK